MSWLWQCTINLFCQNVEDKLISVFFSCACNFVINRNYLIYLNDLCCGTVWNMHCSMLDDIKSTGVSEGYFKKHCPRTVRYFDCNSCHRHVTPRVMVNSKVSIFPFTLHIKVGHFGTVKGFRSILLISRTTLHTLPDDVDVPTCRLLIYSCRQTDIWREGQRFFPPVFQSIKSNL